MKDLGAAGWKKKLAVFIVLVIILFLFFNIGGLISVHNAVQMSDISEMHLYSIRHTLFTLYLLQFLQLVILVTAGIFTVYWIVTPYHTFLNKISLFVKKSAALNALCGQETDELKKSEQAVETLIEAWKEPQI
ncbi:MAG: hypothetical protein HZA78_02275 [Candidatus Schekmanbacteria bacterium]|nr:hypothetical protein [Candidatus Schekmanbacteria bacterium]